MVEDISLKVEARETLENMNLEILQTNTVYEKFVPSHFLRLLDKAAKIHLNQASYCLQHGISPEWEEAIEL